eukprot:2212700-Prymnesium_polylepis.1
MAAQRRCLVKATVTGALRRALPPRNTALRPNRESPRCQWSRTRAAARGAQAQPALLVGSRRCAPRAAH